MPRVSAKGAARAAQADERRAATPKGKSSVNAVTHDSFINLMQGVGLGAQNGLQGSTYGFNPITRNRILLEWIHRGSWLGGMAVDVIGDDMTRKGVEVQSDIKPEDMEKLETEVQRLGFWNKVNEVVKWGRLYGGCLGVALIDGQDPKTPLRLETVGKGQFKGVLPLDRWMVTPALEDLVTDLGPHLGQPKFYSVQANAPALRGQSVHYSRVLFRHLGVELPYNQALTENLWGVSIYERFYDRMVGFDNATMGAAQLVNKAYLRTLSVEGLRDLVAAGGVMMAGFVSYVQALRQFQSNEGISVIDAKDTFEVQQSSAFSGISDVILQLGQQVSGALGIPLVRLLGQSPAGLSATGDSDWRNYYDGIAARQNKDLSDGVNTAYKLTAQSVGIRVSDEFRTSFKPMMDLTDKEKAEVAKLTVEAVGTAKDAGLFGAQTSLKELKQSSGRTGVFSNISQEQIDAADDEIAPPMSEQLLDASGYGTGVDKPGFKIPGASKLPSDEEDDDGKTRPNGQAPKVDSGARRRVEL